MTAFTGLDVITHGDQKKAQTGLEISAQNLLSASGEALLALPELHFNAGQCWAILGPNGVGKSTFLQHCSGRNQLRVRADWRWQGQPLPYWSDADWSRQRAFLPQQHVLTAALSVSALVRMAAYPWGGVHARLAAAFALVVEAWDLQHLLTRRWTQLSGGEQQRVQLARSALQVALADTDHDRLWLLDEPLTALDWPHQQLALKALKQAASAGALVIFSVHDINAALTTASHVMVMAEGHLLFYGALPKTRDEPRFEVLRQALEHAFQLRLGTVSHPDDGRPWLLPLN